MGCSPRRVGERLSQDGVGHSRDGPAGLVDPHLALSVAIGLPSFFGEAVIEVIRDVRACKNEELKTENVS